MGFFQTLVNATEQERQQLFTAPIIHKALQGDVCLQDYIAFLSEAYHHVKHTVPLLMATGSRLQGPNHWLQKAIAEYIEEEIGHEEWILNDLAACGLNKEIIRLGVPHPRTELMVAYAYDQIQRVNPLGFFGMVHVLEGTSITTAERVAGSVQQALGLPNQAFTYLRSHGALDQEHVKFFEDLMNRITNLDDQLCIIHSAKMFYQLYGDIFRSLTATPAV